MKDKTMFPTQTGDEAVVVCAAIIIHQQKILLTLRPLNKRLGGFWEFPGGKLEPGESRHEALHRELHEELDITVDIVTHLATVDYQYDWGNARIEGYLCRFKNGTLRHLEVADHAWVTIDELDTYRLLPADQPFIEKIRNYITQ